MKKLLIVLGLSLCAIFTKAQSVNDTLHVKFELTVPQVQTLLNGLSELRIKDGVGLYLSILNQSQAQIQEANAPKITKTDSSAAKKEEPTKAKK